MARTQLNPRQQRTRVKICGITSVDDARAAVAAGADAIGLVFYPASPRAVNSDQARAICSSVPAFVSVVGLCVDLPETEVKGLLQRVPLDLLQFHGGESPEYCRQFDRPYIKALRMKPGLDVQAEVNRYESARSVLLDAYRKGVPGGTGEQFDWDLIPVDQRPDIILAGGLNGQNIRRAIACVQPYAVDVSGGVEQAPGRKDHRLMSEFIRLVNDPAQA